MRDFPNPAFTKRQAQWEAFHRWESSKAIKPLSLDERITWYASAYNFSVAHSPQADTDHIHERVNHIRRMQERLAYLNRSQSNG